MPRRLGRTYCDSCDAESAPYVSWPTCTNCGGHYCDRCYSQGSLEEDEGRLWCECWGCHDAQDDNDDDYYEDEDRDHIRWVSNNYTDDSVEDVDFTD